MVMEDNVEEKYCW